MNRRLGRFLVPRVVVDDNLAPLIYREVVPHEVRYRVDVDGYEVSAWSKQFDEIHPRESAPWYVFIWEFETTLTGNVPTRLPVKALFSKAADEAAAVSWWLTPELPT